jgi:hypothetical protein
MPNHVSNTLVITGSAEEREQFVALAANEDEDTSLSFAKFVDPQYVDPQGYLKDWYDWSVKHWGTKWDAYDVSLPEYDEADSSVSYNFLTAWAAPIPAITAMSKQFPNLTFTLTSEQEWGEGEILVFTGGFYSARGVWATRAQRSKLLINR